MARLREDGAIVTEDGSAHKSPSGAARHLNGNKPIDGWNVWVVVASGKRLSEIRELQSN